MKLMKMSDRTRKKLTTLFTWTAAALCVILLGSIGLCDGVSRQTGRTESGLTKLSDITETEKDVPDAPIGVMRVYEFTLADDLKGDTSLAFYTVHQYATVKIDGKEVYRIAPSGRHRVTKTVAGNWVMIPLYTEDSGKKVTVEITPVYESFRSRKAEFLVGTPLSIYRDRLTKDLPQLILAGAAILIGVIFLCIAGYGKIRRKTGNGLGYLGLFSVMLGIWRLTDTRFTPFMDFDRPVLLYYISILMPMFGILPLIEWTRRYFKAKGREILAYYEIGVLALCIIQTALQIFGVVDLRQIMITTHLSMGIGAGCIVGVIFYERKQMADSEKRKIPVELGMAMICVAGIMLDVTAFYVKGNSSGLVFTLLAFLIYVTGMGIITIQQYGRQQIEIARLDRQLTDSRIKAMMSQIRSHFIFNVLATISTYCKIDPKQADKAIVCFSRYLRRNINHIEEDGLIDFHVELEQVKDYVSLEKLRFADRVEFVTDLETESFQIPPLTIQPVVENAIKHGIIEQGRSGIVVLQTIRNPDSIEIKVIDDGVGFDPAQLGKSGSVGIRNVRYRLKTLLGGTLEFDSVIGEGTTATIRIPLGR